MNFFSVWLILQLHVPVEEAALQIKISGFNDNRGKCVVMLFQSDAGFPKDPDRAFQFFAVAIQNQSCELPIRNLAPGIWAVSVFHDANENGKVDTNFVGIPKEGIGVSNNKIPALRPPHFDECKFLLKAGRQEVRIAMTYL